MIFERKNEMGDTNKFEVTSYDITLYRDPLKPHTCKLVVPKNTPFRMFDVITASINDFIPFRGYITNMSIPTRSVGTKILECESIEHGLNKRFIPPTAWETNTKITTLLSHSPPSDGMYMLPLIWYAQSYIPVKAAHFYRAKTGTGYLYGDPNVSVFDNCGTDSRIGDKDLYIFGCKSTEYESYADMPSSSVGPAHVRFDDRTEVVFFGAVNGYSPRGWLGHAMAASSDMAFDFGVRTRTIEADVDDCIEFSLQTDYSPAWDTIVNVATKLGLNINIWYDKSGYTYLDFITSSGRGETGGQMTFYEDDINVESLVPSIKTVSALIGRGIGSRSSRQIASAYNLYYHGIWIEEIEDIDNGLSGVGPDGDIYTSEMQDYIDAQYSLRNVDCGYRIKLNPDNIIPRIRDYIKIVDHDLMETVFEVKRIKYSSSNPSVIVDVGFTPDDLYDAYIGIQQSNIVGGEYPFMSEQTASDSDDMTFGDADTNPVPADFCANFGTGPQQCRILASISYELPFGLGDIFERGSTAPQTATARLIVNGITHNHFVGGMAYKLGDPIDYVDITDYINFSGSPEDISFEVRLNGQWIGTPPTVSVSITLYRMWI